MTVPIVTEEYRPGVSQKSRRRRPRGDVGTCATRNEVTFGENCGYENRRRIIRLDDESVQWQRRQDTGDETPTTGSEEDKETTGRD